jgi:tRNA G46 methylase TrmB
MVRLSQIKGEANTRQAAWEVRGVIRSRMVGAERQPYQGQFQDAHRRKGRSRIRLPPMSVRADQGCADGALLAEVSHDFPDSDLFGIDLSSEFASRFQERQRAGEFGGAYVHFFHRNLLDRIFEPESIDTTICNSTLH